jgi:hypothetical protein
MTQTYYSPFFPDPDNAGAKGSTIPIVTSTTIAAVIGKAEDAVTRLDEIEGGSLNDTVAPNAIVGLVLTPRIDFDTDGSQISVIAATWPKSVAADLNFYELEIAENGGGAVVFASGESPTPKYEWRVRAGQTFTVRVRAVDDSGNRGAWSNTVTATSSRDTTPPSDYATLAATTGFNGIYLTWTNPNANADADLSEVLIYESTTTTPPAVPIATVNAIRNTAGGYARTGLPVGSPDRYYWVKGRDTSGNLSVNYSNRVGPVKPTSILLGDFAAGIRPVEQFANLAAFPAAGTNGRLAFNLAEGKLYRDTGTAWVKNVDTSDLLGQISNTQLADDAVDIKKLADGLTAVEIVNSLPTTGNYLGRTVVVTGTGKLWRWSNASTNSGWTSAVEAVDVSGQLTSSQIADAAIDAVKFANGLTPVERLNALPLSGNYLGRVVFLTTDSKLYRWTISATTGVLANWSSAIATSDLTGTIVSTQITDGSISTPKLAANSVVAEKIVIGALSEGLVWNPGAEAGTDGWFVANRFNTGTLTSVLGNALAGTNAFALTKTATTPNQMGMISRAFSVVANKTYVLKWGWKGSTAATNGCFVRITYSSSRPADTSFFVPDTGTGTFTDIISDGAVTTAYVRNEMQWTAPAGASWASIEVLNSTGGPLVLYVDDVNIFEVTTTAMLADGAVVANKILAGAVISDKLAANSVSASKIVVSDFSNIVVDSSMVDPASWSSLSAQPFTFTSSAPFPGVGSTNMLTMAPHATINQVAASAAFPIEGDRDYYFSNVLISAGTPPVSAVIRWYSDVAGSVQLNPPGDVIIAGIGISTGFVSLAANRVSGQYRAPLTAKSCRILYFKNAGGTATAYFGEPIIRRASSGELLVDGTITGTKIAGATIEGTNIKGATITGTNIAGSTITGSNILAGTITTGLLGANIITANQIAVGDFENLALNGDFNYQQTSWDGGTGVANQPSTSADHYLFAPNFQRRTGAAGMAAQYIMNQNLVPVKKDDEFYFEWVGRASADLVGSFYGVISWYNRIKSPISGQEFAPGPALTSADAATGWIMRSNSFKAPQGAGFVRVGTLYNNTAGTADVGYVALRRRNTGNLLVDGTITGTKIAGNTITGDNIVGGTISAAQLAAGSILADKILIGTIGQGLILNGGAETGIDGWQYSAGFATGANYGLLVESTIRAAGTNSFRLRKAATTETVQGQCRIFPVVPSKTYTVRWMWRGSTASSTGTILRVGYYPAKPADYAPIVAGQYTDLVNEGVSDTTFAQREFRWTAPANANWANLAFISGSGSPLSVYFDDVNVYETSTTAMIGEGAVTAFNIKGETITGDKIFGGTITGDKISTTTSLPGTVTVGTTGVTIETVRSTASTAATNASSALTQLGDLANDNILSKSDKSAFINQYNQAITATVDAINNSNTLATTSFGDATATTRNDLTNARDTLTNYLQGLHSGFPDRWKDPAYDTPVNGGLLRSYFGAVYNYTAILNGNNVGSTIIGSANPAARINLPANTTKIDPGKITITGATTLADWKNGPDSTEINGGSIAANTIVTSKLKVGARGISFRDLVFQLLRNSAGDFTGISWSAGTAMWVNDSNVNVDTAIAAGSGGALGSGASPLYFYWPKGGNALVQTYDRSLAVHPDSVHIATHTGGVNLVQMYGGTIIDGANISTGTLSAEKIIVGSIEAAQIKVNAVTQDRFNWGANGNISVYNHVTSFGTGSTTFVSVMGLGIQTKNGDPIHGMFSGVSVLTSGAATGARMRVVRVADGTPVWGGSAGLPFTPGGLFTGQFLDSVPANVRVQYDVQIQCASGQFIDIYQRVMRVEEMLKYSFSEIQIYAPNGEGPGAGSGGGGNVNGDTTTAAPALPNSTYNPAPVRGGFNRYTQIP